MSWISKYKYLLLVVLAVFAIITVSIVLTFNPQKEQIITNPDFIYNTWRVEKLYKNGKLVINSGKYQNLYFQVNRDGTAEWIKEGKRIKLSFIISPDGTQIITDDGMRIEDVENIFELRQNVLRFGKRNINAHYEYVCTSVNTDEGNFIQ